MLIDQVSLRSLNHAKRLKSMGLEPKLINAITKDQETKQRVIGYFSTCFEKHFEYRFIEMLRNFSQHNGLPVNSVAIQSRNIYEEGNSTGRSHMRISLMPTFSKRKILANPEKLRRLTADELRGRKGSKICAMSYLRIYISLICECHEKLRTAVGETVSKAADSIAGFSSYLAARSDFKGVYAVELHQGSDPDPIFVGVELVDRYNDRKSQWSPHGHIFRSFVSTQIVDSKDTDFGDNSVLFIPK